MSRTSSQQLPDEHDLIDILRGESQRYGVKFDFIEKNPELYTTYKKVAVDTAWIDTYAELPLGKFVKQVNHTTDTLYNSIRSGAVAQNILDSLFNTLAIDQKPQKAEALFVFGSGSDDRVAKAVELYHAGYASKLILSGNRPHFDTTSRPEAERMLEYSLSHGVPRDALFSETQSITLPDNVKRTLDMLEHDDWRPTSLDIIASTFVMRRAVMEWYRFCPWDIALIPVSANPAGLGEYMQREHWYETELGTRLLLNEYAKIAYEHKMELLRRNELLRKGETLYAWT